MEKIIWDDQLNIGVEVVDKAHAKLFRITGKLIDLTEDPQNYQHTYSEGIKYLEDYSMKHFSEEEAYMRSIRYKGYLHHKRIHDNFRDKTLVSLKKDLILSHYSPAAVQRFVGTVNTWLVEHIMSEDQAIVGRGPFRKGQDLSSQITIISRVVNRAMTEEFQVGAKLGSADYKGQYIGNGFYCHQLYELEGGGRLQLLLGMEEPLLLRGVNLLPGMQSVQPGEITNEAALQAFARLMPHFGKMFRAETQCPPEKDDMLTKDMFRADFMKGYPCSLLFATRLGYFVFCYRSIQVKKTKP